MPGLLACTELRVMKILLWFLLRRDGSFGELRQNNRNSPSKEQSVEFRGQVIFFSPDCIVWDNTKGQLDSALFLFSPNRGNPVRSLVLGRLYLCPFILQMICYKKNSGFTRSTG